jgi:hypothetical protein
MFITLFSLQAITTKQHIIVQKHISLKDGNIGFQRRKLTHPRAHRLQGVATSFEPRLVACKATNDYEFIIPLSLNQR